LDRLRTLRASTSALSFTSAKAAAPPSRACDTDLASRCDCVCAWPAAATCDAPRLELVSAATAIRIRPSSPAPNSPSSTRCWRAVGHAPMIGRPEALLSSMSPGMRVSLNSAASSDGAASEMIDESPREFSWSGRIEPGPPMRMVSSIGLFSGGGGV
jgi:hypothetical protein